MTTVVVSSLTLQALFRASVGEAHADELCARPSGLQGTFIVQLLPGTIALVQAQAFAREGFDDALLRLLLTKDGLQS